MALHQFANDFFGILGSSLDHAQLTDKLALEWTQRCCGTGDASVSRSNENMWFRH